MGAYIKQGVVTDDAVGVGDPRSIVVTSKTTPTTLILKSNAGAKLEFNIHCPAYDTKIIGKDGALQDRFPTGQDLTATIKGDTDSFVRIDF